ncbi:MAG: sigma-70 family RNA polymerase sigma factor [Bacillus sp. (in: Bacteria)]|nr:sigma-70 family RNA polymerase sigma factor [Bacillus sp. (in: firmicutes)]
MEKVVDREREFEECCQKYTPMIHSIITKWRLGRESDEYFQIGLVALYEAWSKYEKAVGEFAPFAYSYITGRIKNEIARNDRWQKRILIMEPDEVERLAPLVDREDDLVGLTMWLDEIPLLDKERLWLKAAVLYGLKPSDVASLYGYNVHTVKSWRQSAVKKLRGEWRGACHDPEFVEKQ